MRRADGRRGYPTHPRRERNRNVDLSVFVWVGVGWSGEKIEGGLGILFADEQTKSCNPRPGEVFAHVACSICINEGVDTGRSESTLCHVDFGTAGEDFQDDELSPIHTGIIRGPTQLGYFTVAARAS
jgi:hypothetical protein